MEDLKRLFNLIKRIILHRIAVVVMGSVLAAFGLTPDKCSWVDPDWVPEDENSTEQVINKESEEEIELNDN